MLFHDYQGDYVIFGAGGLARELWGWIKHARENGKPKRLVAFIEDDRASGATYDGIPIVGRDAFAGGGAVAYILAVGSPQGRAQVSVGLAQLGWAPLSYVHETVLTGVQVSIGEGVVVCPRASLSSDCAIHDFALINGGCAVAHDVVVGRYSALLGSVSLNGNVTLGEGVTVGAGAIIHPGRRVGNAAVIGMGSVVFSNVAAGRTVVGNPAKYLAV